MDLKFNGMKWMLCTDGSSLSFKLMWSGEHSDVLSCPHIRPRDENGLVQGTILDLSYPDF